MIDRCGRNIDYLRISVTDRCNLRVYILYAGRGVKLVERAWILQEEEIVRICRVMAELGISKIKLTGGEPLVRPGISELIKDIKKLPGIQKVTLTTNGVLLKEQMQALAEAGLDGLNISLDTLSSECYQEIARRDYLEKALEGMREALRYPEISVKVNCVPLGTEAQELWQVAALAEKQPLHVRFIEMMPIGYGREFRGMTETEVIRILENNMERWFRIRGAAWQWSLPLL